MQWRSAADAEGSALDGSEDSARKPASFRARRGYAALAIPAAVWKGISMTNRSETFGRLLKAGIASIVNCEGKKAAIIEDELGQQIGVSGDSIQRYKSGHLPPEERTVEILATAAVQRGYLGREWLQRFLHAARYPFADKLLDQLRPLGPARPRPLRVYHNLPAPTYSQFVMRQQPFDEVVDGLQQRSAAVLIVGLGGNGKTSLAREVAAQCLKEGDTSRFDAVVWVSDKDRPGTTNLSIVLDEIARTLDYPGFTQFAHDEKLYEVGQLLKRQRVLVVVDNFETITDGALLTWLLRLPEPSKAIVTSREYNREYRRGGWPVELRGMSDAEAHEFVNQRLHVLRIERLISDQTRLEPLLVATGGNPKAIEIALGLIKHERRPLQQVVNDLYAARGDLFDDLFTRAWALLDEAARRVLLVTTFFPDSTDGDALSATADVQGFALDRAAERLTDLALLDVQQENLNSMPRYALHPLVRAFARARLHETVDFEKQARLRWANYFLKFATQHIVNDRSDLDRYWRSLASTRALQFVDPEWLNLRSVLEWTVQGEQDELLVEFMMVLVHYMDRIALFQERIYYCQKAVAAARKLGRLEEAAWLQIDGLGWAKMEEDLLVDATKEILFGLQIAEDLATKGAYTGSWTALANAHLARRYLLEGRLEIAAPLIEKAISIQCEPIVKSRVLLTAGELAQKKQETMRAIGYYIDAITIIEEYESAEEHYDVRYRLGFAYLAGGELEKAEAEFNTLTSLTQQFITIAGLYGKYGLASVAKSRGEIDNARRFAEETRNTLSRLHTSHRLRKEIRGFLAGLALHR
jgi:tetratricopeptide (TPR) repeat protein